MVVDNHWLDRLANAGCMFSTFSLLIKAVIDFYSLFKFKIILVCLLLCFSYIAIATYSSLYHKFPKS